MNSGNSKLFTSSIQSVERRKFIKTLGSSSLALSSIALASGAVMSSRTPFNDITKLTALELSAAIRKKEVSCLEVMKAYLSNIRALNGKFKAIVSLADESDLLTQAKKYDEDLRNGQYHGWMHGFPHSVKDLSNAKGFINSKGSPLYRNNVSTNDDVFVARMKAAGAIIIGKTNVPEFGLGSNSYNPVYGVTRNAYDGVSTAGGSSGGAAAALALQFSPVADGSDLMGSLRNPAAYNNVIGFRPTPGRIPLMPSFIEELPCYGPMGRTVADTAMLLSTMAGHHASYPNSLIDDPMQFTQDLGRDWKNAKIAWLGNFDGYLPMENGVLPLCEKALESFLAIGAHVEEAKINYSMEELWEVWLTFRHWLVMGLRSADYTDPKRRAFLKPECVWEVEGGQKLNANDVFNASFKRARFYAAILEAFTKYDFLALPTAQMFPFHGDIHWPKEIANKQMDTYHRWMEVSILGTLSGCPIASVPAGFNANGLPMGIQIIGPRFKDFATLQMAYAYEEASRWNLDYVPPVLRT